MPLIVSQSIVSADPLDHNAVKAVGIDLPLTNSSTGFFGQTYTTPVAIRVDLQNLLLTRIGERAMNPTFGSPLYGLIFEQMDENIEDKVNTAVRHAVNTWMPFVSIQNVKVNKDSQPADMYKLKITISYYVQNVLGESTLTLLVT